MNKSIGKNFIKSLSVFVTACLLCLIGDYTNAAERVAVRRTPASRRTVTTTATNQNQTTTTETTTPAQTTVEETVSEPESAVVVVAPEPEAIIIENKSGQFNEGLSNAAVSSQDSSAASLAEQIRKQRAAFEANEAANIVQQKQNEALATGRNICDSGLRKCMQETCGSNFTKCALDGDTMFGEKLNKCRRTTTCTGEEFRLFTTEIKADRDLNVQMASYTSVIECGNTYNNCIQTECGATFGKCLGKNAMDKAIKKCSAIAKNCTEQDSGLASRMGIVIGKLRENAEKDVKTDEKRLTELRDLLRKQCEHLGAMFDERSFDCVYTVNFFAGENQSSPTASRKAYAGSSFVCMQEWFGINATTFKENAYRETRSQTAASGAMLGAGLGIATGMWTSGAVSRAMKTNEAKKDYKKECKAQGGKLKDGECIMKDNKDYDKIKPEDEDIDNTKAEARAQCKENGGTYVLGKCWGGNGSNDATAETLIGETLTEDGINHWGYNFSGRCGKFDDDNELQDNKCARLTQKGTWWTSFSWGIVYGEANCDKEHPDQDLAKAGIIPCFCRLTAIDDKQIQNAKWVQVTNDNGTDHCQNSCASECASYISISERLRKELLGNIDIDKNTENGNSFFGNIKSKMNGVIDNTKKKIATHRDQKAGQKNQEQEQQELLRQQKAQAREDVQNLMNELTYYK